MGDVEGVIPVSQHPNNFIVMLVVLFHQLVAAVAAIFTLAWALFSAFGPYFILGSFSGWIPSTLEVPHWMTAGIGLSPHATVSTVVVVLIGWLICIAQALVWVVVVRRESALIERYLAPDEERTSDLVVELPALQPQAPATSVSRRLPVRRVRASVRRLNAGYSGRQSKDAFRAAYKVAGQSNLAASAVRPTALKASTLSR